jgi:hypothetical protein
MWNAIPGIGWMISLAISISLAVPFWIAWTACGIGESYFFWLPPVYHRIGFWACVGLFTVISVLRTVLLPIGIFRYRRARKDRA